MRCSEIYAEFNLSNCVGHSLPDLDRWVRHAVGMPTRENIDRKRLPFYERVRSVKRHKSIQRLSANPRPTRTQHRPIRKVRSRPGSGHLHVPQSTGTGPRIAYERIIAREMRFFHIWSIDQRSRRQAADRALTGDCRMRPRFDIGDCRDSLFNLRLVDGFVIESGVDERLIAPIGIRAAHIDGCESSIDFHVQKARMLGEAEAWLSMTSQWRRASIYNPVERAVLNFTELLMQTANGIWDQAYDAIRDFFMPKDIARLMIAVSAARMWDQLALLARSDPRSRNTGMAAARPQS